MDSAFLANALFSMLLKKGIPTTYPEQCQAVKALLIDDVTGLIGSLTNFAVSSAKVDFSIETDNATFNAVLKEWLDTVNIDFGTVPMGIKALAEQYYMERWQGSSFAVLQIAKWEKFGNTDLLLPTKMFFVDGSSIHAEDVEAENSNLSIDSYKYFVGESDVPISSKSAVMNRPYCRWHDKYPTPYLMSRGIYQNAEIIKSLKNKETEILDQIIPYLLLAKKGSEALSLNGKTYTQTELQSIANQFQDLMTELKSVNLGDKQIKSPIRVTNFDEDLKHFIPDLSSIFNTALFEQAERNIMSGLGFIDVVQGISNTRRESTLNPKVFIQEVNAGVESFKEILRQLLVLIKYKNESHIKYTNSELYVCSSPVKSFMTAEFLDNIRLLYTHGGLSKKTYTELVGGVDYDTEKFRRVREAKSGDEYTMYPQLTVNNEDKGIDVQGKNPDGITQDTAIPKDKQGDPQKYNFSSDSGLIDDEIVNSSDDEMEFSALKKKVRITERYLRYRQIEPTKFEEKSFRTVIISPSLKIKAIVGKIKGEKNTTIQSYLFAKEKWTDKTAKEWLTEHSEAFSSTVNKWDMVSAPYTTLQSLPDNVRKMSKVKQEAFRRIFNEAFRYMLSKSGNVKTSETYAFRTAYSGIKRIHDSSLGFWERMKEKFHNKKMEVATKQALLLDKLLNDKQNEEK
jgi:cation transport regulator ChaB